MITSIKIQGYRGFEHFEMAGLGRINLLVGTNNSGKTSVLEAIYLLTSLGDPSALWQLLWRRGERSLVPVNLPPERVVRRGQLELDVARLFTGHDTHPGARISLQAHNHRDERFLSYTVSEINPKERQELFGTDDESVLPSRLVLQIKGSPKPAISALPLSRNGSIGADSLDVPSRRFRQRTAEQNPALFITTESMTGDELISLWNKVALTPSEGLVLRALQFLDPNIERIAAQVPNQPYYSIQSRGGFIVKRKGQEQPIPIGSMGDGMWRMLAMAIAITQCRGGVLLVDEIDTGLHYTVMSQMWRLIFNAAKELDVQVFATTHSYDCVYSLAQICVDPDPTNSVTVQRIEAGKSMSVPYDQEEITVAAQREIEVR
jgi:hypothetical protein